MFEVTLFCLFEHLIFRPTVATDSFTSLQAFTALFAERGSARLTPFHFDPTPETETR